jgi:hypothetical protein
MAFSAGERGVEERGKDGRVGLKLMRMMMVMVMMMMTVTEC